MLSLELNDNELTGTIPSVLSDTVGSFNFAYNHISGTIPTELGSSSALHLINVSATDIGKFCFVKNVVLFINCLLYHMALIMLYSGDYTE